MEKEIYYKVEKIKKTTQGRILCIRSNMETTFEMQISEEQFLRFGIKEGAVLDDNRFLSIREEMLFDNARRAAFSILSCGENNKKTLSMKLQARGFSYELSKNVAVYMEHRGYIDEKKQIGLLCEGYLRKGFGKQKIINELVTKGYQREDVMNYVSDSLAEIDFGQRCAQVIVQKHNPLPQTGEDIKKMIASLMRLGYTVMDIKNAIDIVKENSDAE